jgi:hypothetical protein
VIPMNRRTDHELVADGSFQAGCEGEFDSAADA